MSGTPILVSGFLSSIFRIKSLSSSLTFGLKKRKEGDEGETADGPLLPTSPPYPAPGFPELTHGSVVKNPPANAEDAGLILPSRKIPWRRKRQRTPVLLPEKPMDRGTWGATAHGVTKESDALID
jgi:hypothetical protein